MQNKRYCFPFFLGIPAGYQITYGDKRWRFRRWCHVRMAKRGLSHPQQASIRVQFEVKPILEQNIILGNQLLLLDSLLQERQVWIAICCVLFGQGRARGKDGFGEWGNRLRILQQGEWSICGGELIFCNRPVHCGLGHRSFVCRLLVARAHAYIKSDKFEQAKEWMNDKNQAKWGKRPACFLGSKVAKELLNFTNSGS